MNEGQEEKTITSPTRKSYTYSPSNRLGSGSFAEVYKGRIDETQAEIAIKVINRAGIQKYGPDIIKAIGAEVNILQKISNKIRSPFIVKIFECFATEKNIYIILEFCNEGTLADVLKASKTLEEKVALTIIYQLGLALDVMADNQIAHRDIKPENIFISDGIYKLGDFGFAGQKKLFGTTLGTYPYMAPEIFKNQEYDNKIDIWAVGVMLHEMLFGELYFIGNSHMEVATNVQNKKYVLDPRQAKNLSPLTQDLLFKSLEKDPKKRLSAKDFIGHKAFDQVRNLPQFIKKIEVPAQIQQPDQSLAGRMVVENFMYMLRFLEGLAAKVSEIPRGGAFVRFYLLDEAMKQARFLGMLLEQDSGPLLGLLPQEKLLYLKKAKNYEQLRNDCVNYCLKLEKTYQQFINEFTLKIQREFPAESKSLLIVIKNSLSLDLEELFSAELLARRMVLIKSGDEEYRRGMKDSAREKLMLARELSMASEVRKLVTEQFDFGKYEAARNNFSLEDLLKGFS